MKLPRYEKYANCSVGWFGLVPAHWATWKVRDGFACVGSGTTPPSDEIGWYEGGTVPWVTTGELREAEITETSKSVTHEAIRQFSSLKLHPAGSLLVAMYGATIGRLGILGVAATTNQACCAMSGERGLTVKFVYYWLSAFKAAVIETFATGGGQPNISQDVLANLRVPAPGLEEQRVISAFLDHETAKIDGLIAEQEKLIALLAEKRQATISHAVTRGLNPHAPMKDSGVPWLGEVPAHWGVVALRRVIAAIEQGWSPECHAREADATEWGVLKAGCLNGGVFRPSENKALPPELAPEEKYEVHAGDVLMSRASGSPELVGSTALVGQTRPGLMLSDKIFRLHLQDAVMPRYFVAAMGSLALRTQIENALSGGNGMANNLPQSSLLAFLMTVPPRDEQQAIVDFIDAEIGKLDSLGAESERAIALLRERRSALIAAAVTGQIDVRGFAAA